MKGTTMHVTLPTDCGNAPRIDIVGQFAVHWAKGDTDFLQEWLTDGAHWDVIGRATLTADASLTEVIPPMTPERVEVISVITHGRLASCDGYIEAGSRRISFSHVFRFASTAKTSKIAELRSYWIESPN
ncbi:nuclear transport factor 2-like protein [Jonesia denitrificans]|uniref:SnoaL-like domain-containing protein n=1 Tax=Jonesia denitrificans (strain ATCC 14870 / DSM 20603 / BCRC 15368 / CIP 55.134 / JCM 11481 / NBRC 15587 / NCTC 10816 / Prevot 55134) TaxID=471856 RepID=C7R4Y4_JONDD|nr:hypothetical protein [Jonesia denitrificans]ACV09154.1 hypothetical protein Jden_1506 [Jonesia denitrificans DSM 20603]SQH21380.1 Uncharacterised protein [Jonesia denitrificans]